jgi:phage terminase small subunit
MNSIIPTTQQARQLTEKQQLFLDNLIETEGNAKAAAELAGYSGGHYQVLKSLKNEVLELTKDVLAHNAPKAAFKLLEIMDSDKPIPQASNKLVAAQSLLDRVGVSKSEKLDINMQASSGIFILPDKAPIDAEAEDIYYEEENLDYETETGFQQYDVGKTNDEEEE